MKIETMADISRDWWDSYSKFDGAWKIEKMYFSSGKAYLEFTFPAQFLPFRERRKMGKFEPCKNTPLLHFD